MYTKPAISEIGSLADLTKDLNKVGRKADKYSGIVPIVGSIVTAP